MIVIIAVLIVLLVALIVALRIVNRRIARARYNARLAQYDLSASVARNDSVWGSRHSLRSQ